ncbi:MAG: hypothetical protein V2A73_05430, partial [Pseudomonadota bacterium]
MSRGVVAGHRRPGRRELAGGLRYYLAPPSRGPRRVLPFRAAERRCARCCYRRFGGLFERLRRLFERNGSFGRGAVPCWILEKTSPMLLAAEEKLLASVDRDCPCSQEVNRLAANWIGLRHQGDSDPALAHLKTTPPPLLSEDGNRGASLSGRS